MIVLVAGGRGIGIDEINHQFEKRAIHMARLTRDDVLKELIGFFDCELARDPAGVKDWLAQGDYDVDEFIEAVGRTDKELSLRDGPTPPSIGGDWDRSTVGDGDSDE